MLDATALGGFAVISTYNLLMLPFIVVLHCFDILKFLIFLLRNTKTVTRNLYRPPQI